MILEQNPWRQTGAVPPAWNLPVRRPLAKLLWARLMNDDPRRFQVVLGPRRVGKTISMYQTAQLLMDRGVPARRVWSLRMDHPLLMTINLDLLLRVIIENSKATSDEPAFLFLDELVYAKDWDLWLKTFYDENRPIRIAGSSSATAALRRRGTESGVGRWDEQYLQPYLFSEYLELIGKPVALPVQDTLGATLQACVKGGVDLTALEAHRRRFILTGGFPELLKAYQEADESTAVLESQRLLRSDAVERTLYKDIRQAFAVENPMLLERLLYTLGGQVCNVLSPTSVGQSLGGMSQPTFDAYLTYLQQSFLVFTLPNYSGSEASVQRRGKKLYFVDGAIRNAALQRGLAPLADPIEMGLLMENAAASHLHAAALQAQVRLYHWRDGNDEVDLVWDHPTEPIAFEIASSSRHSQKGLHRFQDRFPRFRGRCFLVSLDAIPRLPDAATGTHGALPLDLLLLAAGTQAERDLAVRLGAPVV